MSPPAAGPPRRTWSFSQLIVAGADADKYRRVPLNGPGGNYRRARLTPDGQEVVVGGANGKITIIDLLSGGERTYRTPASSFTTPLAVSANGRWVAFIDSPEFSFDGDLYTIDLHSGEVSPKIDATVEQAAFSPHGPQLVYQARSNLYFVDVGSTETRLFQLPARASLAGSQSWSPNGQYLVAIHTAPDRVEGNITYGGDRSYVFIQLWRGIDEPFPPGELPQPRPIPGDGLMPVGWGDAVLGWTSPKTMLVSGRDVNGTTANLISEVDITNGEHRVISRFRVGPNADLAVGDVQLAANLLEGIQTRSNLFPDRGRWPTWAIVALVLCCLPATLTILILRLRRRRRSPGA